MMITISPQLSLIHIQAIRKLCSSARLEADGAPQPPQESCPWSVSDNGIFLSATETKCLLKWLIYLISSAFQPLGYKLHGFFVSNIFSCIVEDNKIWMCSVNDQSLIFEWAPGMKNDSIRKICYDVLNKALPLVGLGNWELMYNILPRPEQSLIDVDNRRLYVDEREMSVICKRIGLKNFVMMLKKKISSIVTPSAAAANVALCATTVPLTSIPAAV